MTRTTISIHEAMLEKVRRVSRREHRTLGETITELIGLGLSRKNRMHRSRSRTTPRLRTYSMGTPLVPLEDKEALHRILDEQS